MKDNVKDKTATIRYNQDLLQKYNEIKSILEREQNKRLSDGATWILCLKIALNNPINVNLLTSDKNLEIRKQIRVNNNAIKDIEKLKMEISHHKPIKSNVIVWRYCLKLAYNVIVGDGGNGKDWRYKGK